MDTMMHASYKVEHTNEWARKNNLCVGEEAVIAYNQIIECTEINSVEIGK